MLSPTPVLPELAGASFSWHRAEEDEDVGIRCFPFFSFFCLSSLLFFFLMVSLLSTSPLSWCLFFCFCFLFFFWVVWASSPC